MSAEMPYVLPDNYLSNLAETLTQGVRHAEAIEDPATPALPKALPFIVPEGYFTELVEQLQDHIAENNVPSGITTPYQTPAGYIESLPAQIASTIIGKEKAHLSKGKIISIHPTWKRASGIAAAALLVLGLGLGSYRYFNSTTPDTAATVELSKLDASDIANYVEQNVDEFDAETLTAALSSEVTSEETLPILEASEIQEYLEESGDTLPATTNKETL
jgi:hypothetical protein